MSNTINRKKLDALKEKLSALPPREAAIALGGKARRAEDETGIVGI